MRYLCCILLILSLSSSQAWAQCEQARKYYEQAMGQDVAVGEKIRLLEESLKDCPGFAAYFELGKARAINGNEAEAMEDFKKAVGYAKGEEKVRALQAMGKVCSKFNHPAEAVIYYKEALKLSKTGNQQLEQELMEIEKTSMGTIASSKQIVTALNKSAVIQKSIGVVGEKPEVDVRVHFDFDSFAMTGQGKSQADEMGKAMMASEFQNKRFKLIGHTDTRGSNEYNDQLSLNRANAVRGYLESHCGVKGGRITVEGKGKRELLYHGESEDEHALNRRVEMVLLD